MSRPKDRKLVAEFEVQGEPVSKSRARFTKRGSKTFAYTPKKTHEGEVRIAFAFRQVRLGLPLGPTDSTIAYRVESEFHNGTRQRRDVDNMTKLVLDGLNGVAWVDDAQVLEIESSKSYVRKAEARTVVRVYEIGYIVPPQSKCIRCGKAFRTYESWEANPNGKKYCSRACVNSHRVERRKRTCVNCGAGFLAWGETNETKFCSRSCMSAASRTEVACSRCGTSFTKQKCHVRRFNYCSPECMTLAASERRSTRFPGTCEVCGSGTTRKEYRRCNPCKLSGQRPSGEPQSLPGGAA